MTASVGGLLGGFSVSLMHATPGEPPEALTAIRLLTGWSWNTPVAVAVAVSAAAYLAGLAVLRRRGTVWPLGRTIAFLAGGLGSAVVATMSVLGTYDTVLFSVHMVQHMVLMMLTPMFLALGAPVTLALRTLPPRPRAGLMWLLHSRLAKVMTFAPLSLALFIASPFALYYSDFYRLSLESPFWHSFLHVHFVMVGAMLMWPLVGVDPVPGRVSYPLRILTVFVLLPFHAFLGISIMSANSLIAQDWYEAFNRSWGPAPPADQYLAGGILWGSGDITALIMMAVLFVQWYRSSQREAVREDRRLDRLEALEAAGQPRPTHAEHERRSAP